MSLRSFVFAVGKADVFDRLAASYGICQYVIESRNSPFEERDALELLLHDLMRYQALFQAPPVRPSRSRRSSHTDRTTFQSIQATSLLSQPGWAGHWAAIEIPLLLCLCSSDPESRALAVLCFQRAAIILDKMEVLAEETGVQVGEQASVVIRVFAAEFAGREGIGQYSSTLLPPRFLTLPSFRAVLAPDVQQKQVRKVLAGLKKPTPGLVAAWDEGMRRWKELSSVIFSRVMDDGSDHGAAREQIESMKTLQVRSELPTTGVADILSTAATVSGVEQSVWVPPRCLGRLWTWLRLGHAAGQHRLACLPSCEVLPPSRPREEHRPTGAGTRRPSWYAVFLWARNRR